jgi:hypothetical protein
MRTSIAAIHADHADTSSSNPWSPLMPRYYVRSYWTHVTILDIPDLEWVPPGDPDDEPPEVLMDAMRGVGDLTDWDIQILPPLTPWNERESHE